MEQYYWSWDAITTTGSPTMTGVERVRFIDFNWTGEVLLLTDGVNPAATYDGTSYTQITDSNAPDSPKYAAEFASHIFLAKTKLIHNLYFSAPLSTTDFNPANGSGVINVGFILQQLKSFVIHCYFWC